MPNSVLKFDANPTSELFDEYKQLRTFAQVEDWDKRATVEIDRMSAFADLLARHQHEANAALEQARQERLNKSAVARMFHNRSDEKTLEANIENLRKAADDLEQIADRLREMIDFTPNDDAERKSLIKELKIEKKELQVRKREVASEMRSVRVEARQASAEVVSFRGWASMAANERRSIRRKKEAMLGPSEDSKAAIERQLVTIDRRILWLERFGSE